MLDQTSRRPEHTSVPERLRGMVRVPGGTFRMGSDKRYPEEALAHRVSVDGFWIDATPVTNRDFRKFVRATGYVTSAEILLRRTSVAQPWDAPCGRIS
jgi:sulfatase modifying factor 1